MYRYFVSFKGKIHSGNSVLERDTKITRVSDIRGIEQLLSEKYSIDDVQLLNFFIIYENDKPAVETLEL